jgi:hypothetical protein
MCPRKRVPRVASLGLAIWCAAAVVRADAQVGVVFEIVDGELAGHFAPDQLGAQHQFARAISELLNGDSKLRFWRFAEGSGHPGLRVQVVKTGFSEWLFKVALTSASGTAVDEWSTSWMTTADLDARAGWGPLAQLRDLILERFRERVIERQRDDILHRLQYIPLGAGAHVIATTPPRPRVVVPLDWTAYGDLSASEFRLDYRTPSGVLSVFGDGVQLPGQYPMPPPQEGLMLQLTSCKIGSAPEDLVQHLSEIQTLQPIGVFLATYVVTPGGSLPAPSVADRHRE